LFSVLDRLPEIAAIEVAGVAHGEASTAPGYGFVADLQVQDAQTAENFSSVEGRQSTY
jgi:hypothetical protein